MFTFQLFSFEGDRNFCFEFCSDCAGYWQKKLFGIMRALHWERGKWPVPNHKSLERLTCAGYWQLSSFFCVVFLNVKKICCFLVAPARSDSTSHSAMSSVCLVVCLSVAGPPCVELTTPLPPANSIQLNWKGYTLFVIAEWIDYE